MGQKMNAAKECMLLTNFCAKGGTRNSFIKLGYVWPTEDGSHIQLHTLPAYNYDWNTDLIESF